MDSNVVCWEHQGGEKPKVYLVPLWQKPYEVGYQFGLSDVYPNFIGQSRLACIAAYHGYINGQKLLHGEV